MKDQTAKPRSQIEEASDKWEEIVYKYFWIFFPLVSYRTVNLELQESFNLTLISNYNLYVDAQDGNKTIIIF